MAVVLNRDYREIASFSCKKKRGIRRLIRNNLESIDRLPKESFDESTWLTAR